MSPESLAPREPGIRMTGTLFLLLSKYWGPLNVFSFVKFCFTYKIDIALKFFLSQCMMWTGYSQCNNSQQDLEISDAVSS